MFCPLARSPRSVFRVVPALGALVGVVLVSPVRAATWVAEADLTTAGGDISLAVSVDDVSQIVAIEMTGSESIWFSVGFGGSVMADTYAIVAHPGGTVEERKLGDHTPGVPLSPSITLDGWSTPGNGMATFEMSRAIDPGIPDVWVFPLADIQSGTPIPIIWAVGQGAPFTYHGGGNRSSGDVAFGPGDIVATSPMSWGRVKLLFREVE
jgi:hypothetical protein